MLAYFPLTVQTLTCVRYEDLISHVITAWLCKHRVHFGLWRKVTALKKQNKKSICKANGNLRHEFLVACINWNRFEGESAVGEKVFIDVAFTYFPFV